MPPTEETLKRAMDVIRDIWVNERRPVSFKDLGFLSKNYARQIFSRLTRRGLIELHKGQRTKPQLWIPVTREGNGHPYGVEGCISLVEALERVGWSDTCFHDIRLKSWSSDLCRLVNEAYRFLEQYGFRKRGDGSVEARVARWGASKMRRTCMVFYRSGTVVIEVSCSDDPIMVNEVAMRNPLRKLSQASPSSSASRNAKSRGRIRLSYINLSPSMCAGGVGIGTVVTKLGARGATAARGRERASVAARRVRVEDVIGAGDVFAGTFLSCLLSGMTLSETLRRATAAGTLVVTVRGDQENIPTMRDIEEYLSSEERGPTGA